MADGKMEISRTKSSSQTPVKLSSLEPGSYCRVVAVKENGRVSRRLQEMGVIPGVRVRMVKSAPFGDPFEVRLLGYSLALRKSEAELVEVVP